MTFAEQAAELLTDPYALRKFAQELEPTVSEQEAKEDEAIKRRRRLLSLLGTGAGLLGAGALGYYGLPQLWKDKNPDVTPAPEQGTVGSAVSGAKDWAVNALKSMISGEKQPAEGAEGWLPGSGTVAGGAVAGAAANPKANPLLQGTTKKLVKKLKQLGAGDEAVNKAIAGPERGRLGWLRDLLFERGDSRLRAARDLIGTGGDAPERRLALQTALQERLQNPNRPGADSLGKARPDINWMLDRMQADAAKVRGQTAAPQGRLQKLKSHLGDLWARTNVGQTQKMMRDLGTMEGYYTGSTKSDALKGKAVYNSRKNLEDLAEAVGGHRDVTRLKQTLRETMKAPKGSTRRALAWSALPALVAGGYGLASDVGSQALKSLDELGSTPTTKPEGFNP